jgi:hypothetical protein
VANSLFTMSPRSRYVSPAMATTTLDEGGNYRVTLESKLVVATVWRREDLSSAEGADLAERMTRAIDAALTRSEVRGFVLDLSGAPPVMGPRTLVTIGAIVQRATELRRTVRIVSGATATGRLQLERLARAHGADGGVVASIVEARAGLAH